MTSSSKNSLPAVLRNQRYRSLNVQRYKERAIQSLLFASTLFTILVTIGIVYMLATETVHFFNSDHITCEHCGTDQVATTETEGQTIACSRCQQPLKMPEAITLTEFALGTEWNPLLGENKHFGIWPLLCGTLWVTVIAMLVAGPLGLVTAIYLSEYAPTRVRSLLKPLLEILAGIPTVVYGFFALTFITPALRQIGIEVDFYNALSGGIAVGILCLPIVSSLSEDALQAVPQRLREAALGLGGTRFDVSIKVVLPAALSGVISAFLLAFSRAVGETMIVALAVGLAPGISLTPTEEMQTMTGYMTQSIKGDISNFGAEYYSMYAVAATLFLMTFLLTVLCNMIRNRFREAYE